MPISDVDIPCPAYLEMARRWDLIDDLMGGTLRMRDVALQGEKWLPRFAHEELDQYRKRVEISVLYNAFADTVSQLTAKPFSEPVNLGGDLPEEMADLEQNADRAGRSLHAVARDSFMDACKYGLTHFQIDMPARSADDPPTTREDQIEGRVRPSIIPRSARDVIGWRSKSLPSGAHVLTQVRIRECIEVADDGWGTKKQKQVLVLNAPGDDGSPGTWQRYREAKDGEKDWQLEDAGTHTYPGVPFVTWYAGQRTGFMTALPPLEDLAWLNLRHWQSSSDQARILQFARAAAMVFVAGVKPQEGKANVIQFMRIIENANPDASATMIEHSGAAVKAGEDDLRKIEERMETLGQQPFLERASDSTATGVRSQGSKTRTVIQSWIAEEENGLDEVLRIAAFFAEANLPEGIKVDIHSEFMDFGGDAQEIAQLITLKRESLITGKTLLEEIQRRRVLSERIDAETEIEDAAAEGPSLGLITAGPPSPQQPPPNAGGDRKGAEPSADGPAGARQAA